jgi:hypothetical protein
MEGMTLRDYFAAKALPNAIEYWLRDSDNPSQYDPDTILAPDDGHSLKLIAETAYDIADAMLKARGA